MKSPLLIPAHGLAMVLASGCGGFAETPAVVSALPDAPDAAQADIDPGVDACGELTSRGTCYGNIFRYCASDGVRERDCAAELAADGQSRVCVFSEAQHVYDCVDPQPLAVATGCGSETSDGRCAASQVIYCTSADEGPQQYDCAPDRECYVSADGYADCRLPGSAGCGRVTFEGFCDGNTAYWCDGETTEVLGRDCTIDGATCGYIDEELGYYCLVGPIAAGSSVTGTFAFEKPALTASGLGPTTTAPIRRAQVLVRRRSDDLVVASGATDDRGAFSIPFDDPGGELYVSVQAHVDDARYAIAVRNCPLADCVGFGNIYGAFTASFNAAVSTDLGRQTVTVANNAGAFNIFDVFVRGTDFAWTNLGGKPPPLTVQWARGADPGACPGSSCFTSRSNTIHVKSTAEDTDEFDDAVLGHEFGHFLENAFSRGDSPGGFHDGSPTDPRLAWSEGYGTYTGAEIFGTPYYVDTWASGAARIDISDSGYRANPAGGLQQRLPEALVSELLWTLSHGGDLTDPLGSAAVFDVLGAYFPSTRLVDRGVEGVDLVDFLDGLMCRATGRERYVRLVAVDHLDFPYDFAGPGACR